MNKRRFQNSIKLLWLVVILFPFLAQGQEILELPKPTHFVAGVPTSTLMLVHEFKSDFEDDLFFAYPWTAQVSKSGMIYVFDAKLLKIFIFNQKYKYIGQFLEQGQGPGEIFPGPALNKDIHAGIDGYFYIHDSISHRLIQFSETGKYIKDTRLNRGEISTIPSPPIVDKEGYFYFYSKTGIVDKLDPKLNVVHTFLDLKLNGCFVGYRPMKERTPPHAPNIWLYPDLTNTLYGITGDGYLLIYLSRRSTAYVFKGKKLLHQFDILIDEVLPAFKKRAKKAYQKQKEIGKRFATGANMVSFYFVDQDDPYFYLTALEGGDNSKLYQFDLKGNLTRIIKNFRADIRVKRNGLFYGFLPNGRNPAIFKLEGLK